MRALYRLAPSGPAATALRPVYARRVDPNDLAEIAQRLSELKLEHRRLDAEIERLVESIEADELAVKRLKKRKLWLKDCIARLESALIPDQPA